jgi:hypothetical protein
MSSARKFAKVGLLAAVFALAAQAPSGAQGLNQEFKGQIKVGIHKAKLEAGKVYNVVLSSNCSDRAFPIVEAFPTRLVIVFADKVRNDKMYMLPTKTGEHTFFVISPLGPFDEKVIDYTLSVKPAPDLEKPVLSQKVKIDQNDPIYNNNKSRFKDFKIQMKQNHMYVIHLAKIGNESPQLYLEDNQGKIVAQDSFGDGEGGARIVFQAFQDGEHRLVATTTNNGTGEMNLKVYALPK